MAPQDDRELINRFKEGDRNAFKELVVRYQQRIYAVAYGIVRDEEAALDVVQDVAHTTVLVWKLIGDVFGCCLHGNEGIVMLCNELLKTKV